MFRRVVIAGACAWFLAAASSVSFAEPTRVSKNAPTTKARACRPPERCKVLHKSPPKLRRAAQTIVFGDDVVRGNRAMGGGTLIQGEKPKNFSHLILVRQNFLPELVKSADRIW